jgi:hypothetical protein
VLLHLSTAVWGPWHLGVFLNANLPSLLPAGNLASLAGRHDVLYRIFTTARDLPRLTNSGVFQRTQQILRVEVIPCEVEKYPDPIAAHHALWQRSTDEAREAGALIVFIPPDVIWSNNSLGHIGSLIESGKRAIFGTYTRAVSETCVPAVRRLFLDRDEVTIDAPPRELVKLMLRHIHPLTLTYLRDSGNFPIHPELALWSVPREGFLTRSLTREMFAYDPRLVRLNAQALPAHDLDPASTHYITDSDDLFSISLAPRLKDLEWYAQPRRLDAIEIANWWLAYDSPANDLTAKQLFVTHLGPPTRESWRRAEIESNALVRRLIGTREILRVMKELAKMELYGLGEILAVALAETKLASLSGSSDRMTLFIPTSGVIDTARELLKQGSEQQLNSVIRDHCVYGTMELLPGQGGTFQTPTGRRRELSCVDGRHFLDGVLVQGKPFPIGRNRGYLVERVLPSAATASSLPDPFRHG